MEIYNSLVGGVVMLSHESPFQGYLKAFSARNSSFPWVLNLNLGLPLFGVGISQPAPRPV